MSTSAVVWLREDLRLGVAERATRESSRIRFGELARTCATGANELADCQRR